MKRWVGSFRVEWRADCRAACIQNPATAKMVAMQLGQLYIMHFNGFPPSSTPYPDLPFLLLARLV